MEDKQGSCSCVVYLYSFLSPKYLLTHKQKLNLEKHLAANELFWWSWKKSSAAAAPKSRSVCGILTVLKQFCIYFHAISADKPFSIWCKFLWRLFWYKSHAFYLMWVCLLLKMWCLVLSHVGNGFSNLWPSSLIWVHTQMFTSPSYTFSEVILIWDA